MVWVLASSSSPSSRSPLIEEGSRASARALISRADQKDSGAHLPESAGLVETRLPIVKLLAITDAPLTKLDEAGNRRC